MKDIKSNKRNEQIAFDRGFRITESGELYHLNGRKYKTYKTKTGYKFHISEKRSSITVILSRFQAYSVYGDEMYKYNMVRFKNGDCFDCSAANILIGKGSEVICDDLKVLRREQVAVKLGWTVDESGNILKGGKPCSYHLNNHGYKCISVPYQFRKMKIVLVHRLAAYINFGKKLYENGIVARHLDGDKLNNSKNNIVLGSYTDNYNDIPDDVNEDRYRRALLNRQRNTEKLYELLKKAKQHGWSYNKMSALFKVSSSTIYRATCLT